jgi:hypothetical protein
VEFGEPGADAGTQRGGGRVGGEFFQFEDLGVLRGLDPADAGVDRGGLGVAVGGVSVGRAADVPAVQGMLDQPFPDFLFELEPVLFRDALLDPPDQYGGGVDAFDIGGLVGGEQGECLAGRVLFPVAAR